MIKLIQGIRQAFFAALLCFAAAVLSAGPCYAGPAATEEEQAAEEAELARLNDNVLEYDEVSGRIEHFNVTYVNLAASLNSSIHEYSAASDLDEEIRTLKEEAAELKDGDMDEETRILYEEYMSLVKAVRKTAQDMRDGDLSSASKRNLRQTKGTLQKSVENQLISLQSAEISVQAAKKRAELREAEYREAQAAEAAGLKTRADVLAAEQSFYDAMSSAARSSGSLENTRQNILVLLGYGAGADVEFARIPDPDLSRMDAMNPENDAKTAIGTNFDIQSLRRRGTSGDVGRQNKKRTTYTTEEGISIQIGKMYGAVISAKAAYEGALDSFAAAEKEKAAADQKKALGMTGLAENLRAEYQYLSAKASRENAAMNLFKAMEDYDWAVNGGLIVSGGQ